MKLLVVLSRFPYPLEKGDKLRAYHQIRCLAATHDIYLAAVHDKPVSAADLKHLEPYCKSIFLLKQSGLRRFWNIGRAFFKGLPVQCGFFYSKKNARKLDKIVHAVQPDHIYCQLFRMAEYVKTYSIPKTIDYQDAFSKGMFRRTEKAPWWLKPVFNMEGRRTARYEAEVFGLFDNKTIITAIDRDLIPHPQREQIVIVPNGVDLETFCFRNERKEYDLIFSGNMNYAPNVDAAVYLAKEIFPALAQQFPGLRLVLCGTNPAPAVQELANAQVFVTGWVDSMAAWYAKARIFVAPMRMGTGLQNKILEAMAMQLPCVASPLACQPLGTAAHEGAIAVCHSSDEYIRNIGRLLTDVEYCNRLSQTGYRFVQQHYDWHAAAAVLDRIMTR